MKRLLISLLAALCLIVPCTAYAASDPGLFGVVVTPDLSASSPTILNSQMGLMAHSGVHWVRTNFDWETTETAPGVYDWGQLDAIVGAAAANDLHLLPVVEFTPKWASSHPSSAWDEYAPSNDAYYARFMTTLVDRYGPRGSFWAANPHLRKVPITSWQIWNEPEGTNYDWRSAPWPKTYTALLKAAYQAVHAADHGATVLSGALVALNCPGCVPWTEASSLYHAGFKHYFDALAINTFTIAPTVQGTVDYSLLIVSKVRAVMRRFHDLRKPIWITELTWTAALHRIPLKYYDGFETTPSGQAQRLAAYYTRLATQHPDNIQHAFWFDWASPYKPYPTPFNGDVSFEYSGLLKWQIGAPRFQPLPLLKTYARVAHRYG